MPFAQEDNFLEFNSPIVGNKLNLTDVTIVERIGRPFEITAHLISQYQQIALKDILYYSAKITIHASDTRVFQGMVTNFVPGNIDSKGRRQYFATIQPWLVSLDEQKFNHFYYNETIPNIVRAIILKIGKHDVDTQSLAKTYVKKDFCVQYHETYLAFIHRLLAEAGIFYIFVPGKDYELPVLRDLPISTGLQYAVNDNHPGDKHIHDWQDNLDATPDNASVTSYQFTAPKTPLHTNYQFDQLSGFKFVKKLQARGTDTPEDLNQYFEQQVNLIQANNNKVEFESNITTFAPGHSYNIIHNNSEKSGNYMVLEVIHHAYDHSYYEKNNLTSSADKKANHTKHYGNTVLALSNDIDYTPAPISKPLIKNITTAKVITPDGQQVYTNTYGAIKVQYPWQADDNVNIQYLPWMRVGVWQAGQGWGSQFIPRANDEILLNYVQGNLQNPLMTGSLYHQKHKTPYDLSHNHAITSISTQIIGQTQGHEIAFDDTNEHEILHHKAQGDYKILINNDNDLNIKSNDKKQINIKKQILVNNGLTGLNAGTATFQVGTNALVMDSAGIHFKGNQVTYKAIGVGGSYPVARLGDDHCCHKVTAAIPHQGGAINQGSSLFKVNNLSAARLGDTAKCLPETDVITEGVGSILVEGKPLTRLGHHTKHNGKITTGSPNVFVSDAGFASSLIPGIFKSGNGQLSTQTHWIQGYYPDKQGMTWTISHQAGLAYHGVLDEEGKTEKITNLPEGTANIYFGDKEALEKALKAKREDLQTQLESILTLAKQTYKNPSPLGQAWYDLLQKSYSPLQAFYNLQNLDIQIKRTAGNFELGIGEGIVKGVKAAPFASFSTILCILSTSASSIVLTSFNSSNMLAID